MDLVTQLILVDTDHSTIAEGVNISKEIVYLIAQKVEYYRTTWTPEKTKLLKKYLRKKLDEDSIS